MTRMLITNAALAAMVAAVAVILLAMDSAPTTEPGGSRLGERALARARGWTPGYAQISGNEICACVYANQHPGTGLVCVCTAVDQPCVVCTGRPFVASGNYSPGGSGWQPSGGDDSCGVMEAMAGSCAQGANGLLCNWALDFGACTGTYPTFEYQGYAPGASNPASP